MAVGKSQPVPESPRFASYCRAVLCCSAALARLWLSAPHRPVQPSSSTLSSCLVPQVPGRAAIRKKVAELSAALAGGEAAGRVLSDAEAADGGPLDCLLDR